ncbi:class I SAM-dependent methyltransferase [Patescibacteria group bacterium]
MRIPTGSELLNSDKIIKKLDLKEGYIVADLGCGTSGHFVFPSARLVGEKGKVYAVDILKSALSSIESRAKMQNIYNVEALWADIEVQKGVNMPDESCDAIYLINVHAKPEMLREALRLLKKNGKLLIVDWKPDVSDFGPASKIASEEAKTRAEELNLQLQEEFEAGPKHWGLIYIKS